MKRKISFEKPSIPDLEEGGKLKEKNNQGSPIKSKTKHPKFRQNCTDYLSEYCGNTSIHGIKYLGEKHRSIFEKLCWTVIFGISLYVCIDQIVKTYQKWQNSPVIVSFAKSPTPVWQIPFPAITICSETKSKQTKYNFTEAYHQMIENADNVTREEKMKFEKIALICDNHLYHSGNKTADLSTIEFLSEVAPEFSEVLWSCKWTNKNQTCDTLFTPMLTEEGVCFTFNMLDREELFTNIVFHNKDYLAHGIKSDGWTLENGYPENAERDTFPRRAISAGTQASLVLLMRAFEQDLDYICRGPVQGFKILLHHPAEIPRVSQQYFRAPLNQEVIVAIKPDMMTTSQGLRDYDPHRRQCYFPSERDLAFYKVYTQQNCDVECLTNFTLIACDCVAYHMPHAEDTPICGPGSIMCMYEAQAQLLHQQVEKGLKYGENRNKTQTDCDCLPACTSLSYNAETSQADFNWPKVFQAFKANASEFPGVQMTRLTIFFKEMQFITSERNELYGATDFLASCGGLLGLFIGFSFLSVVEIFYFLSLRLMCNMQKHGRHFWSGSPELLNNDAFEH